MPKRRKNSIWSIATHPVTLLVTAFVIGPKVVGHLREPKKRKKKALRTVTIYGAPWCPACMQLKNDLESVGVSHTFRDIEEDPQADAFVMQASEEGIIPVVTINGKTILGYDKPAIEEALGMTLPGPMRPGNIAPDGWIVVRNQQEMQDVEDYLADKPFVITAVFDPEGSIYTELKPLFAAFPEQYPLPFIAVDMPAFTAAQGKPLPPNIDVVAFIADNAPDKSICTVISPDKRGAERVGADPDCIDIDLSDDDALVARLAFSVEEVLASAKEEKLVADRVSKRGRLASLFDELLTL